MKKEELLKLPVLTRQQRIAEIAQRKRGEPLTLLHHYIDETWLRSAYFRLRKESAPGIDGQTVLEYGKNLDSSVRSLLKRAKTGTYKAPAGRGTRIPKPGKKKEFRPLGIPTTEDKVLQKAVLMVLEPIYELEFYGFSYGFGKGKSQHQALDYLWHEIMYKNIYLHEALDKWFVEVAQPRLRGRSLIVRFADDVIPGFENKTAAEKVLTALNRRFERYGLELHPEKTRLLYFVKPGKSNDSGNDSENDKDSDTDGNTKGPGQRSFDFLGFTHYWGKSLKGKWIVKRKTASKKLREKLKKMNEWCKEYRHYPIEYQYEKLCQKLKGHYAYYGITGNMRGTQQYLDKVKRIWKKWLCRRNWKTKLNREKSNLFLTQRCPLPPVKVVHSIYAKRAAKQ